MSVTDTPPFVGAQETPCDPIDPTALRRQAYADAAALLAVVLEDMARLNASTARLVACTAEARRLGLKLPVQACVDADVLAGWLSACRAAVRRMARLATAGG